VRHRDRHPDAPAGERLIQGLGVIIAALGGYILAQTLGAVA
jgi:urease accessory protein